MPESEDIAPLDPVDPGESGMVMLGPGNHRVAEFGLSLLLGLFTALSAFPPSGEYFAAWLTIPTFALASIHFLRRSFDPVPRLTMDAEGITDRTSILGGALRIPWSQIRRVSVSWWHNGVQLEVGDLDALQQDAGVRRALGIRLARLVRKETITLDTTLLGISRSELRGRVAAALDRYERESIGLTAEPDRLAEPSRVLER